MFHHQSLGVRVNIRVTKLILLHKRPVSSDLRLQSVTRQRDIGFVPASVLYTTKIHLLRIAFKSVHLLALLMFCSALTEVIVSWNDGHPWSLRTVLYLVYLFRV